MPKTLLASDLDMANVRSVPGMVARQALPDTVGFYDHLVGLLVIAVVPTAFWTAALYLTTWACGAPLAAWVVALVGGVMFAFLVCIWASFTIASRRR
jgi:hypothetical protein